MESTEVRILSVIETWTNVITNTNKKFVPVVLWIVGNCMSLEAIWKWVVIGCYIFFDLEVMKNSYKATAAASVEREKYQSKQVASY